MMIIIEVMVTQGKMLVRCEGANWGEGGRRSVVDSNDVELKLCFWPRDHAGVSGLYSNGGSGQEVRRRQLGHRKVRKGEGVLTREIACEQWRY